MDSTDNYCLVCHEAIEIFAIGKCDHPICYKCSTRMRGLCDQLYCPICRTDLPEVFFLTKREKFSEMPMKEFIQNRRLKIQFENESVRQEFEELLEHRCKICPERHPDKSFKALQDHMRRVHTLFFCDLCLGLKIFSRERKYYNRQDLAIHRRVGDKDDTSYKGHPLCQFCDERYLDKDELYKHLRKDHYFCHFCESLGSQDFFQEYSNLRDHFATDHFLCEEGECIDKQFENAFRSEIDLKAHRATYHSKAQSKFQSRQERTLNIDINLVPRPTNRGRGTVSREDYDEVRGEGGRRYNAGSRKNYSSKREKEDVDRVMQASLSTMTEKSMKKEKKEKQPEEKDKNEYVNNIESFPTLGDSGTSSTTTNTAVVTTTETSSLANKFAMSHNMSVQHGRLASAEDFPTLTKSSSGSDLRISSQPAVNYQSLKSSQSSPKGAPPQKTSPSKQSLQTKKRYSKSAAFSESVEDFPELPVAQKVRNKSAVSSISLQISGAETSPVPTNISFIREKPSQPEPKRVKVYKPKYDDNEFPSLGGPAASGPASQSKWFKSGKNSSSTEVNVNSKEDLPRDSSSDFRIIDRYSPVNIPDTPKSDKKNKGKKKKESAKSANPREQVKTENTKNSLNENSSLDNIASLLMNPSSKSAEYTEKEKIEYEPETRPNVKEAPVQRKSKVKEYTIEKKMASLHLYDEPQSIKQVDEFAPVKVVTSEDDFPSLGSSKSGKKPPPGFKQETQKSAFKAPPGFPKVSNNPPPGFVSKSVASNSNTNTSEPNNCIPVSSSMVNVEYIQPDGFSQRNKDLIGVIQSVCTYPSEFAEFKRFSGEFRRSDIGAQLYYEHCEDLLGKKKFASVFPELLALLPDIPKQQELLTEHMMKNGMKKGDKVLKISGKQGSGKGAWKQSQSGFLTCMKCQQVLLRKDYNAHVSLHNLDSDFPSLSTEPSVDKNMLGSYGLCVKAK